ncbi:MAG: hypothetical protein IIW37_00980 [Bacteroidaceae bacterium]|nr:hypothetical protein [Bacteroidaceae bacterium]
MRHTFILSLLIALLPHCKTAAQTIEPQDIKSILVEKHDPSWYRMQQQAWRKETLSNPRNERAWRNCYEATRYWEKMIKAVESDGLNMQEIHPNSDSLMTLMQKSIPNTYTFHLCYGRHYADRPEAKQHMEEAIRLMPENPGMDYDILISYLWMSGQYDRLPDMCRCCSEETSYPLKVLEYNYNQLVTLERNAVIICDGDIELIPKLLLQHGLDIRTDVEVVPAAFLWHEKRFERICKRLNIAKWQESDSTILREIDQNIASKLAHLVDELRKDNRTLYMSCSAPPLLAPKGKTLRSEGLVLSCKDEPYDNIARAFQNVELHYELGYLRKPNLGGDDVWYAGELLHYNTILLLAPLMQKYVEKGMIDKAENLYYLLKKGSTLLQLDEKHFRNLEGELLKNKP